jgi:hypothetical protein
MLGTFFFRQSSSITVFLIPNRTLSTQFLAVILLILIAI